MVELQELYKKAEIKCLQVARYVKYQSDSILENFIVIKLCVTIFYSNNDRMIRLHENALTVLQATLYPVTPSLEVSKQMYLLLKLSLERGKTLFFKKPKAIASKQMLSVKITTRAARHFVM